MCDTLRCPVRLRKGSTSKGLRVQGTSKGLRVQGLHVLEPLLVTIS